PRAELAGAAPRGGERGFAARSGEEGIGAVRALALAGALALVAQQPGTSRPASLPASSPATLTTKTPAYEESRKAIARGLDFLVSSQNPDGSWGGTRNKTMTDGFANAQTHHAWDVATTGL